MAIKKFTCPPQASAQNSFSDELVGFQLVNGGGLTQGNFEFTTSVVEKVNRNFDTGVFSNPISLNSLGINSVEQARAIFENNFKVYPNFDLTQITNFVQFGSMVKRMSVSITTLISKFPASIEINKLGIDYSDGPTIDSYVYYDKVNQTKVNISVSKIRNPFGIDFSTNSTNNLRLREVQVSPLRNMTLEYTKYSMYVGDVGYNIKTITPTNSLISGTLSFFVEGKPFSGTDKIFDTIVIRPNDQEVNKVFNEDLDEVENFLLNRNITPIYTAQFKVPRENDDGNYYISTQNITWPKDGQWNIDIRTPMFDNYLENINEVSELFDSYLSNLVSRFLVTGAFNDFDTEGQKMKKMLQIYGRSFDETKKYISALAFMTSVNYNIANDIPSQLLKNLAKTLGYNTDISPITETDFIESVFGQKNTDNSDFSGISVKQTPDELNYQFYRNLCLNAAYLFKSKGTRKSIETLMRLIGAPEALVEFNEYVYVADSKIKLSDFEKKFRAISGGTYIQSVSVPDPNNLISIFGIVYCGYTSEFIIQDVNIGRDSYPMDEYGYPKSPEDTETYFFQKGSGWFESTPKHRSIPKVNKTLSVFTGTNPNIQTSLVPYTYGQDYMDRFRNFPYMNLGFGLKKVRDNNKSWSDDEIGFRQNLDEGLDAKYYTKDEKLVLNSKNIDLFLNPSQAILYDIWNMSRQYNYPIPNEGLFWIKPTRCNPNPNPVYPDRNYVDATKINPQPKQKTFFEFAETFWKNMINVRNRQFFGGYPTLQSILWKYMESEENAGIPNNDFTYQKMVDYVQSMGDYWIRLVEQMIPASTLWNTGFKYENSVFHRQKFLWKRQASGGNGGSGGGGIPGDGGVPGGDIPIPCRPCQTTDNIYTTDCPIVSAECSLTPSSSFSQILGSQITTYLQQQGTNLNNCLQNTIVSNWFIDITIDGNQLTHYPFFNGVGYNTVNVSYPNNTSWEIGLNNALTSLSSYGYDYYLTESSVVIYNGLCSLTSNDLNLEIAIGINFEIKCN